MCSHSRRRDNTHPQAVGLTIATSTSHLKSTKALTASSITLGKDLYLNPNSTCLMTPAAHANIRPSTKARHPTLTMMPLSLQAAWLLILGIPVASVAWTVTHEEVFREPRQYCQKECTSARNILRRKFFYLFTCEYCFSHYVAVGFLFITRFKLLYPDWRGYLVAGFALVWVANQYMSIYNRLRLDIKHEQVEIKADETKVDRLKAA